MRGYLLVSEALRSTTRALCQLFRGGNRRFDCQIYDGSVIHVLEKIERMPIDDHEGLFL